MLEICRKAADLFVSDKLSIGKENDLDTPVSDQLDLALCSNRSPGSGVRSVYQETISRY